MLDDRVKRKVTTSWRLVVPIADTAADLFYNKLFELRPDYRRMFSADMATQKRKLIAMLGFVVKAMDWADADWQADVDPNDDLFIVTVALGRRHAEIYRIPEDSYGPVGEALLYTLDYGLGPAFDAETRDAWTKTYRFLSGAMKLGGASPVAASATTAAASTTSSFPAAKEAY